MSNNIVALILVSLFLLASSQQISSSNANNYYNQAYQALLRLFFANGIDISQGVTCSAN